MPAGEALHDRRQRAREAALDTTGGVLFDGLDEAIEVATRVQIGPDVVDEVRRSLTERGLRKPSRYELGTILRSAFTAAGFEVEE